MNTTPNNYWYRHGLKCYLPIYAVELDGVQQYTTNNLTTAIRYIAKRVNGSTMGMGRVTVKEAMDAGYQITIN